MFSNPDKNVSQFQITPGTFVADLGSGSGFYTFAASKAVGNSGKVFAVDINKDMLEKISRVVTDEGVTNIETVWGDIDDPNGTHLASGSVHKVIVSNVLFQVENKDELARETARILKTNGQVMVVDWADSFGGLGPQTEHIISAEVARDIFENAGFEFDNKINTGDHHWGFIMTKKESDRV